MYYDATRKLRKFTDSEYRQEMGKQSNKYQIFYKDYNRNWADYKVMTMIFKLILTMPATILLLHGNNLGMYLFLLHATNYLSI